MAPKKIFPPPPPAQPRYDDGESDSGEDDNYVSMKKPTKKSTPITEPKIIDRKLVGVEKQQHQSKPSTSEGATSTSSVTPTPTPQPKSWLDIKSAILKELRTEVHDCVVDAFESGKKDFLMEVALLVRSEIGRFEAEKHLQQQQQQSESLNSLPPAKAKRGPNTKTRAPSKPRKKRSPTRRLTVINDPNDLNDED